MERPSWAPVIFSGALPREFSDILGIAILGLASIQLVLTQPRPFSGADVSWILLLLVPLTSVLSASSNSVNREREELALFAYGGSPRQIAIRYALRGSIITAIGLSPLILRLLTTTSSLPTGLIVVATLLAIGGSTYSAPAVRRTRSLNFVEQYKG